MNSSRIAFIVCAIVAAAAFACGAYWKWPTQWSMVAWPLLAAYWCFEGRYK